MSAIVVPRPDQDQLPRQAERRPFSGTIQARRGMARETVEVLDISATGARIRTLFPQATGQPLWLRLPRLEPIESRIVWTRGCESGCEFVRALHPAVFESIAQAN